ncbi:MAG: hypothetical protein RQ751_05275 [Longimicrobiales bacterium]|nr:hypothetical protein [Longimicrobiales bacterium]
MNVVDLLVTIVVVTILVTIVLAVVTYVAYKLRLAREPSALEPGANGPRFFVRHPPQAAGGDRSGSTAAAEWHGA